MVRRLTRKTLRSRWDYQSETFVHNSEGDAHYFVGRFGLIPKEKRLWSGNMLTHIKSAVIVALASLFQRLMESSPASSSHSISMTLYGFLTRVVSLLARCYWHEIEAWENPQSHSGGPWIRAITKPCVDKSASLKWPFETYQTGRRLLIAVQNRARRFWTQL